MTELVYKKRLSPEQKEKNRIANNNRQYERIKAERQGGKVRKRVPLTKEEIRQRTKELQLEQIRIGKELDKKPYISPSPAKMLRMIDKIGRQKIADKLGFPVSYIISWNTYHIKGDTINGWSIRGKLLTDLQEYFGRIN